MSVKILLNELVGGCKYFKSGPYTTLSDNEFRDALWHRLGLAAAVGHATCEPSPNDDPKGFHRLGCKSAALARLRRHNSLASVVTTSAFRADPRAFQLEREVGFDEDVSRPPGRRIARLRRRTDYARHHCCQPFHCGARSRFAKRRLAGCRRRRGVR